jgi:hypothetical protein
VRGPAPAVFSARFVQALRGLRHLRFLPTVRTAVALSKLLTVRRLRIGTLTGEDFLECAQLVVPPEDQTAAREVALDLLDQAAVIPFPSNDSNLDGSPVSAMRAEIEMAEAIEKDKEKTGSGGDVEDLLTEPDMAELIDLLGGVEEVRARFEDAQGAIAAGKQALTDRFGALTETEFGIAVRTGLAEKIAEDSQSAAERTAAKVVLGRDDLTEALSGADHFDVQKKILSLCRAAKVELGGGIQDLADHAGTIHEMASAASMGLVTLDPEKMLEALRSAMKDHSFADLFDQTGRFPAELAEQGKDELFESYPGLSERELSDHARLSRQWKKALDQAVESRAEQAAQASFDEGLKMLADLHTLSRSQADPVVSQHLTDGVKDVAAGVAKRARTMEQLLELIHTADAMGAHVPPDALRERGDELGIPPYEMEQILSSRISLLSKMIETGETVHERFSRLILAERPNRANTENLAEQAIKKDNRAALAALGNYNLAWTLSAAEELGHGHEQVISSLSAGVGSNLLTQWFKYRDQVPEKVRKQLRTLAREVLIQYAVHLGKELIGDSSRGVLEGEAVRDYVPGDDPSLVDLEETVENIVSQGKNLSMVVPEDLKIRKTVHGRRAAALLVDISGSMHGEKLTWCAVAAAMLAYAMRSDELAVAFFESDTHVVKSFSDRMEIDEVADQLLNLRSRGGTMMTTALDWITGELAEVGHRRKSALILTDAAIFDLKQCAPACRMLAALNSVTTWFVPSDEWAQNEARALAKWSRGGVVRLGDRWQRFPALIGEALR